MKTRAAILGLTLIHAVALAAAEGLAVIAPRAFHPALQEFVAHKQTIRPTELHALESVLAETVGADDPEKLKRFLYDRWKKGGLGFALLVGDVDVLPVRYMTLDRITPAAFDYSFYPSDLYYGDLARTDGSFDNWNAQTNSFHGGYFGEVRGEKNKGDAINFDAVDYRPEIAVGRWPVSSAAEARLIAEKSVCYEISVLKQTAARTNTAALFAVGGWVDTRRRMDRWKSHLSGHWDTERRYYSDTKQSSGTPPPDHAAVRSLFNTGIGLAIHTGHGQPDSWEQCFNYRDLDRITNGASLPVVVSAGCSTAYFAPLAPYGAYVDVNGIEHAGTDNKQVFTAPPPAPAPYQRGRFNPTGLGEQLLKRSTNGAVAYIGCNTGSQPCGLTLVDGFVASLANAESPTLGGCWADAVRHYYEAENLASLKPDKGWYPPTIFFQAMKFMVFGDPSLRMPAKTAQPKPL